MANAKRYVALVLVLCLCFQLVTGCASRGSDVPKPGKIEESKIYQDFIEAHKINEEHIKAQYITEHLILEEGIYEVVLCEQFVCQSYVIETVITEKTAEEIATLLPPEMEDYDIDWPTVISQFAIGTAVIIVVGVVFHATKGQSYFLFGSPLKATREAIIGGAIDATINVMLNCPEDEVPIQKTTKYAVEGFAEGYMWGAISSVVESILMPDYLHSPTLGQLVIDNFGNVKDKAGNIIGKALYNSGKKTFTLLDDAGRAVGLFDSAGKALLDVAGEALEPNSCFLKGFGDDAIRYWTDASGSVYQIGDNLVPNTSYILDGVKYETDDLGRIVSVTFENLQLKPQGQARKSLSHVTIDALGKGYEVAGDQKGHLIADRFRGANSIANLTPMSPQLNQGKYAELENIWALAIEHGQTVDGTIKLLYDGKSFRPSRLDITYFIDGIRDFKKLFN